MWPPSSSATRHHLNYNLSPELGVVGLRDLFLVAPASSFHHHHQSNEPSLISSDPHSNTALNSSNAAATALGVGVGVFPLLTAPCLGQPGLDDSDKNNCNPDRHNNNLGASIHPFWQNQNQNQNHHHQQQTHQQQNHNNFHKKTMMFDHADSSSNLLNSSSINGGGNGGGGGASAPMTSSATTLACQDCGNQAKKDCCHRRCRTCCKNRGYDCSTHVKSTWVPAARRRERQLMSGPNGGVSSGSTSGVKKPRLVGGASQTTTTSHTSNSNNTPPRSFETSSSHQDASFKETLPGQVRAPAVFRCVRVTALEEGEDEYAYQAIVKIGGHVFKGFLYDQGSQGRDDHGYPNLSELHLGGGGGGLGRNNGVSSSTPMLDAAVDVFASAGALLGGGSAAYGNQMN